MNKIRQVRRIENDEPTPFPPCDSVPPAYKEDDKEKGGGKDHHYNIHIQCGTERDGSDKRGEAKDPEYIEDV